MSRTDPDRRAQTDVKARKALEALWPVDPTLRDAPPAPGSTRRAAILEDAMSPTTLTRPTRSPRPIRPGPSPAVRCRGQARRWTGVVAAAGGALAVAAALAVSVGTGALTGDSRGPSPARLVLAAADRTADVTSFRARATTTSPDGTDRSEGEVNGLDALVHVSGTDDATYYQHGTQQWTVRPGMAPVVETTPSLAELSPAAAHVVAAVVGSEPEGVAVRHVGSTTQGGQRADHYAVTPDASMRRALQRVPAGEREWFGLRRVQDVTGLDVWVAGGLISRIDVRGSDGPGTSSSIEFYDMGADLAITAPPGVPAPATP